MTYYLGGRRCLRTMYLALMLVSVGCESPDLNAPAVLDQEELPWNLSLSANAITMSTVAPYDTLQLTATARTVLGEPLVGASTATFTSTDSSVRVSPTGLLMARQVRSNVRVIASIVYRGIRIADTAVINVTNATNPPRFHRIELALQPGDSAKISAPNGLASGFYNVLKAKSLQVGALDSTGAPIASSVVRVHTSDPLQIGVARPGGGGGEGESFPATYVTTQTVNAVATARSRIGVPTTLYATATVYGVTHQDSLQLLIIPQALFVYTLTKSVPLGTTTPVYKLDPPTAQVIAVGGYVWWANFSPDSLDIVFDDPTVATSDTSTALFGFDFFNTGGGTIAAFPGGSQDTFLESIRSRQFLRAGTFRFHSVRTGVSGVVIVQ